VARSLMGIWVLIPAINILNEGYRKNISGGTSDYKRRAKIRLSSDSISNEALKEKELI